MGKANTIGVYLMKGTGSGSDIEYSKLCDIVDFPDMGGAPESLDTTTLSDDMETQEAGIVKLGSMEFTAYLDDNSANLTALEALEGEETDFALFIGKDSNNQPDGHIKKYGWKGKLHCWVTGGGVNEVIKVKISIARSTVIEPINAD